MLVAIKWIKKITSLCWISFLKNSVFLRLLGLSISRRLLEKHLMYWIYLEDWIFIARQQQKQNYNIIFNGKFYILIFEICRYIHILIWFKTLRGLSLLSLNTSHFLYEDSYWIFFWYYGMYFKAVEQFLFSAYFKLHWDFMQFHGFIPIKCNHDTIKPFSLYIMNP